MPTIDPMRQRSSSSPNELRELLEQNQEYLKAILHSVEKTRKYIFIGRMITIGYVLFVIAMLVTAALTLPPLLSNAVKPYQELLSTDNGNGQVNPGLVNDVQKFLKDYSQ